MARKGTAKQHQRSTSQHTPGPWHTWTVGEANAHLIAASPDLLHAVLQVLEVAEDHGEMTDIDWGLLRRAVAKAKGR